MKKWIWGIVVVAAAVFAVVIFTNRGTVAEEKIIIKETDKTQEGTVTEKTTITPAEDEVERKTAFEPGVDKGKAYLKEDVVTIKEVDEENMFVTVIKEDTTYRKKFRKDAKENLLKQKGKKVKIWSTYPLEEKTCEIVRCEPHR